MKMNDLKTTKLPTYEEALAITEASEAFYVQRGIIEGYEYAMFNYRLAMEKDFLEHNAWELRGLTYLKDGDRWVIYPMLTKFLNMNQGDTVQYNVVKDKKIDSVEYKEDGSLISLLVLPNGKVVSKTKMSFENDQTKMVDKWLEENPKVSEVVRENTALTFLFELVSPRNKIVLCYPKTELRLLQVRGRETGEYKTSREIEEYATLMGISCAETFNEDLDTLISKRETLEDVEGWIIKFTDGQFMKLKTLWYIDKHGIMDDMTKENKIIKMIMDDTIDDVLGELDNGSEEKERLEEIIDLVEKYFNHRVKMAYALRETFYDDFKGSRKDFAIANSKVEDFGVVMKNLNSPRDCDKGISQSIRNRIIDENFKLEKAREFIYKLKG